MSNWLLLLTVGLVAATGCNSDTYPVVGTVHFKDGSPVSDARVIFRSTMDGKYISAFATTDENGEYSLTTWQTDDGAVPGEHSVIVTKPRQPRSESGGTDELLPREIDKRYASYETTPLHFTVRKEENVIDIPVERAK